MYHRIRKYTLSMNYVIMHHHAVAVNATPHGYAYDGPLDIAVMW